RLCVFGEQAAVTTLAGGFPLGLVDSEIAHARLNRPTGLALTPDGALVFADSGNGLLRAFIPNGLKLGHRSSAEVAILKASEIRASIPPRCPFDPPTARREIAATFCKFRGERQPE